MRVPLVTTLGLTHPVGLPVPVGLPALVGSPALARRHDAPGGVISLGDGLLKLIIQTGSNPYRVIFFKWGPHTVALTCFYKNTPKTPKAHIDRAAQLRRTRSSATARLRHCDCVGLACSVGARSRTPKASVGCNRYRILTDALHCRRRGGHHVRCPRVLGCQRPEPGRARRLEDRDRGAAPGLRCTRTTPTSTV